ncbi:putative monooxygenase [Saccharomyces cerevisiae]|nr:putative monooxygenase [Saccharomyces cerevisiae]
MLSRVSVFKPASRGFSVLSSLKITEHTSAKHTEKPEHAPKCQNLSDAQAAFLDRVIRVDQAGELGADYIYAGQYFVLAHRYPHLKPVLKHMWDQEIHHHNTFNNLQLKRRVRPSLLTPLWKAGAFAMGAGHYNGQLRNLANQFNLERTDGTKGPSEEIKSLTSTIQQFRDDELEHLDTAIKHDSYMAVPYTVITEGIKTICRVAIWSAERI